MNTLGNQMPGSSQIEQKLWQHELDLISQDNDFLLNLLVSVQDEHLISTRDDEKAVIFFNYFQYFIQIIKRLKGSLTTIDKAIIIETEAKNISNYSLSDFKEEMNSLEKKYQTFKSNFKTFIIHIVDHTALPEKKVAC